MRKKLFVISVFLLLVLLIIIVVHYKMMTYSLSGTYSAGNEPDKDNIYMVIKNGNFTLYNQEKILESGSIEEYNLNSKFNIYKLVSRKDTTVGYIVHDKKSIILLDFKGMDFLLKKTSTNAIYLNYESE